MTTTLILYYWYSYIIHIFKTILPYWGSIYICLDASIDQSNVKACNTYFWSYNLFNQVNRLSYIIFNQVNRLSYNIFIQVNRISVKVYLNFSFYQDNLFCSHCMVNKTDGVVHVLRLVVCHNWIRNFWSKMGSELQVLLAHQAP